MKNLQSATNNFPELLGLNAPRVWDTELAFVHLKTLGEADTKRTAERRLNALGLIPKELSPETLRDEHKFSPNRLLLNWAIKNARKRRKRVLFLQMHPLPDGQLCLHANDARSAHFWIPVGSLNIEELQKALIALQSHIGKPIAVFPHGQLVAYLREQPSSNEVEICCDAYRSELPFSLDFCLNATPKPRLSPTLKHLEAESIHILREAVSEAQNPAMLYSFGKDSSVMLHLALKAFYPSPPPFPLLHIDTLWKFREMYQFRDFVARESGMELLVYTNPEAIEKNINPFEHGSARHTYITKTEGLKQALEKYNFDVVFGGARRDEEKSRSKERIFSLRTSMHRWEPKNQRPELWNLYNTRKNQGENIRVFPLSNWTELDIWQYIYLEKIRVVPLYFAKLRPVVVRPEMIMLVDDDRCLLLPNEDIQIMKVRFRTLGCYPLTGAMVSEAETLEEILLETLQSNQSERQGRTIDKDSLGSMEKKKLEGYF